MADNDVAESLLLSLGLDLGPIKATIAGLPRLFDPAINQIKSDLGTIGRTASDSARASATANAAVANETAKITAELKRGNAQIIEKLATLGKLPNLVKSEGAEHTKVTEAIKTQNEALAAKNKLIDEAIKKAKEEHGLMAQIRDKTVEGAFGGGSTAKIIGGALTGSLIGSLIAQLPQFFGSVAESLSGAVKEASNNQQMSVRLQRLAKGAGRDGNEMLSQMSEVSEGEVSRPDLQRTAVSMLQNQKTLGATNDQLDKLYANYMRVADANGVDMVRANDLFRLALVRGQPALLERYAGLVKLRQASSDVTATMSNVNKDFTEQAAKLGVLPITIETAIRALKNGIASLYQGFALGLNNSPGMQAFLHFLDHIGIRLGDLESSARKFGEKIGDAFYLVQPLATTLLSVLKAIGKALLSMAGLNDITNFLDKADKAKDNTALPKLFIHIGAAILTAGFHLTQFIDKISNLDTVVAKLEPIMTSFAHLMSVSFRQGLPELLGGTTDDDINKAKQQFQDALKGKTKAPAVPSYTQMMLDAHLGGFTPAGMQKLVADQKAYAAGTPTKAPPRPTGPAPKDPGPDWEKNALSQLQAYVSSLGGKENTVGRPNYELMREQQREETAFEKSEEAKQRQFALDAARDKLSDQQGALQAQREAEDQFYQSGEEAAADHYKKLRQMAQQQHDNTLEDLKAVHTADLTNAKAQYETSIADIRSRGAMSSTPQALIDREVGTRTNTYNAQVSGIDTRYKTQKNAADRQLAQANAGVTAQDEADKRNAARAAIETVRSNKLGQVSMAQSASDKYEAMGVISPDEWIQAQTQAIDEIFNINVKAANDLYALEEKNDTNRANKIKQLDAADLERKKATQALLFGITDKQISGTDRNSQQQMQILQGTLSFQQANPLTSGSQNQTVRAMIEQLRNTRSTFSADRATPGLDPEHINELTIKIQNIDLEIDKWTKTIEDNNNAAKTFGTLLSGLGKTAQENFLRPGTQKSIATVMQGFGQLQSGGSKLTQQITGSTSGGFGNFADDLHGLFHGGAGRTVTVPEDQTNSGLFGASNTPDAGMTATVGSTSSATESLGKFTSGVTAAAAGVGSFVASLTQANSPGAGAAGGAASGAGLGAGIGGAFSKISSAAGPIGAAVGATLGLVMGGIMGQKNKIIQQNIDNAANTFKIIMQDYNQNNNNLQTTMIALESLISQLTAEKDSSKKGGQQYQSAIDQYSQQLMQLQNQQVQIINNLYKQLSVLDAPFGDTDVVSQLQQILTSYNQFLGAAGNAQQLAQANQFLQESITNLEATTSQQLNQDQEQAIQDAISLNDQLYQRYQLTKQYNDQVQGILSQGVLTRQMTMAQTKGQQIEDATDQYTRQMQTLNEQISVSQYRVQAEQQIYNLATTRAGLEMQLADVQKAAVDYDMVRIQALTALAQAFSTGNWQFGPLQDIIQNIGAGMPATTTIGGTNAAQLLAQALQGLQGSTFLNNVVAGAYGNNAMSGSGIYRGQNLV